VESAFGQVHNTGQYYTNAQGPPVEVITNQQHIPGANARGTNFIATSDWVYVLQEALSRAGYGDRRGKEGLFPAR